MPAGNGVVEMMEPIITPVELRALLKCSGDTIRRQMKANKLPPFDLCLSNHVRGWKPSTLMAAGVNVFSKEPVGPCLQ